MEPISSRKSPPRRILLVEDNGILAMNIQEMLLEAGAEEVLLAASVAQALPLVDPARIDVAILDYDLGKETSVPVARELRAADIRFVFASGYGLESQLPPELSGQRVLMKPFLQADLENAIFGG